MKDKTFVGVEPLHKGWSSDQKYYIETAEGRRLLLRIADSSEYSRKKTEFAMMGQVAALGVPMSRPVDFGICDNGRSPVNCSNGFIPFPLRKKGKNGAAALTARPARKLPNIRPAGKA